MNPLEVRDYATMRRRTDWLLWLERVLLFWVGMFAGVVVTSLAMQ